MRRIVLFLSMISIFSTAVSAKVVLPPIFSDNMVLQQQSKVAVWGTAAPQSLVKISSSWSDETYKVKADKDGRWSARIATPQAGGPYTLTFNDGKALTLSNVLIGEVWFCGGQSNMDQPVKGYHNQPIVGGMDAIACAKPSTSIRMCHVMYKLSRTPLSEAEGSWQEHTPQAVSSISAVAYFFAEQLYKSLDIPIGIIMDCWGGSSIQTWMSREVLERDFPGQFDKDMQYVDNEVDLKSLGLWPQGCATLCFNGMINPIVPFTFKGIIWYQGCSNRGNPKQYTHLQTSFASMMRELFEVPDAPFYFVEIAPHCNDSDGMKYSNGYFKEAQAASLKLIPHSAMVSTVDVGEFATIHPSRKKPVGQRLAYLALQNDYGFKGFCADSPTYEGVEFKDGKAYVKIDPKGMGICPMGEFKGFEIAGADRVFRPAKASNFSYDNHNTIEVYSDDVPEPVAVRYCFRDWCEGTVHSNFGIPLPPFRTDDWDDLKR